MRIHGRQGDFKIFNYFINMDTPDHERDAYFDLTVVSSQSPSYLSKALGGNIGCVADFREKQKNDKYK